MAKTSYGRRLQRVESKLEAAEQIAAEWLDSGWEVCSSIEGRERVLSVRACRAMDDEFGHLVYEIAEGLLATLDLLAFAISKRHYPSWDGRQQERSAFPILDKEPADRNERKQYERKVECWPEEARQVLESLQPYRYEPGPALSPLWLLRDLANRGKHRVIPVVQSGMGVRTSVSGNGVFSLHVIGPVNVITEVPQAYMRVSLANTLTPRTTIKVRIKFGRGPLLARRGVIDSLNELHDYVKNTVVKKLLPFA